MLRAWLIGAAMLGVAGFLIFLYRYLDDLASGRQGTFAFRVLNESTGLIAAALFIPGIVYVTRRFRFHRDNWYRVLPVHLGAVVVFSLGHTTLMALSRELIAPKVGLGQYNYGLMRFRYPMEMANFIIVYWLVFATVSFFDAYREARDREVAAVALQQRLAEAQLQNLRLQLQPHFLFNALNTISSVMYEDVARADAMLAQLSDLLRRTLKPSESQQITLSEELSLLQSYVGIMQARFGENLKVEMAIDPSLDRALVPQLVLQPLVENSIRHAASNTAGPLAIAIRAARDNGHVVIQVSDNGPGIGEAGVEVLSKGIGLSNTAERLQTLYGSDHALVFQNRSEGGLTVTVRLPYRTAEAAARA